MNLKNYTSTVPASATIARIEQFLLDTGKVTGISKEYAGRSVKSLIFMIEYQKDRLPMTVKLPANVSACHAAFWQEYKATRGPRSNKTEADFLDQAERTAWKLQQDWVEVQCSLIRLNQQEVAQAFLPYIVTASGATVYEQVRETGFQNLLPEKSGG